MFGFLNKKGNVIHSITNGRVVSLQDVPDKVFAERMMGDGFAVVSNDGKFYAPIDATVSVVFPTGHAIGLTTEKGIEILIHVGIDTVQLEGKGFDVAVSLGDHVKTGDLLLVADLDIIAEAGYSIITPVIITSNHKFDIKAMNQDVTLKTEILEIQ